jgi:DNA-binding response OmpR family regulator
MAHVLVAEPDCRVREFVAGILSDCGHAVETCADENEASSWLGAGTVDVVVSDLVLSRGEGAVFRQNCAAWGIPAITLSGREFRAGQRPTEQPPSLLEKPFRFADLKCVLEAVALRSRSARRGCQTTHEAA